MSVVTELLFRHVRDTVSVCARLPLPAGEGRKERGDDSRPGLPDPALMSY